MANKKTNFKELLQVGKSFNCTHSNGRWVRWSSDARHSKLPRELRPNSVTSAGTAGIFVVAAQHNRVLVKPSFASWLYGGSAPLPAVWISTCQPSYESLFEAALHAGVAEGGYDIVVFGYND